MKNFRLTASKKVLALLIGANTIILSGCNKTIDCDITETHAHAYTNEDGITRFIQSEKERQGEYNREDTYIYLDEEEQDLNRFETKKDLIKIADNLDELIEVTSSNNDYYIYEYTYKKRVTRKAGKTSYRTWRTKTGWTATPDNIEIVGTYKDLELTGNIKRAHYTYQTYKVIINEKGKYELVEGPILDNIEDATSEYPYIKTNFGIIVYLEVDELEKEQIKEQKLVD